MNRRLTTTALFLFAFLLAACAPPHDSNTQPGDEFDGTPSGGGGKLAIVTDSNLPQGAESVFYSIGITARGGSKEGYMWSVTSGALPGGLSLADGTPRATLDGTPSSAGTYDFTLMVTDSKANTTSKAFTLIIQGAPALAITTLTLPDGNQSTAYSQGIIATGGTGAGFTWVVSSGSLPNGLSLASGTPSATLSGTPTIPGTFNFTLQVTDSGSNTDTQAYTVDIASSGSLTITTTTLADGTRDVAYSANINATGGSGAGYTWAVTVGSLPAGLTLAASGTPTTTLSGTPTVTGSYSFTVEVTDSLSNTDTQAFTLDINDPTLTITTTTLPAGQQDVSYSQNVTAQDGTATGYNWSVISGSLPGGLMITSGTPSATIEGTPNTFGTFNFTVQVTDSGSNTDTQALQIIIAPPPIVITTTTLPDGDFGVAYSELVTASGGTGAGYTWTVSAGALPGGLSVASGTPSATLSGTPNSTGTFNFTLQVTDSGSNTDTQAFTVIISPFAIVTTVLPDSTEGFSYNQAIFATGGTGAGYSWTVSSGSIPTGLTLAASGTPSTTLSGTPMAQGTFNFTVQVTDSGANSDTQAFTVIIAAAQLQITTTSPLPTGSVGIAYSQAVHAIGGTAAGYTWTVIAGAIPANTTLTSGTPDATIAGTPNTSALYSFTLRVQDSGGNVSTRAFEIRINLALNIVGTMSTGKVGVAYTAPVVAQGGSGSGYTWTVSAGALPGGVSHDLTGQYINITGTPNTPGTFNFTMQVTDSAATVDTQAFTIIVESDLTITTVTIAAATSGSAYSQNITATGGSGAGYTWTVVNGSGGNNGNPLPTGLTLTGTGTPTTTLAGTPTGSGTFVFFIRVTDSQNGTDVQQYTLTVAAAGAALLITTTSPLPSHVLGSGAYTTNIVAINGTGTHTWTTFNNDALPDGLALAGTTGTATFSGTPLTTGTFTFTVQVTANSVRANKTFTWTVLPPAASQLVITTLSLPSGRVGTPYSQPLTGAYGLLPYSWAISAGSLPNNITLTNGSPNGTLSGTPTAAGVFNFTVQLTDATPTVKTRVLSITIDPASPLTITTTSLPDGKVGQQYGTRVDAIGGSGLGYTWSVTPAGTLPGGLDIYSGTPYGALGGVPYASGTYSFTVRVIDSAANVDTQDLTIEIGPSGVPLDVTTEFLPYGVLGVAYTSPIVGTGGSGIGYNWIVEAGYLPPGLSLSSGTPNATLSGTPELHGLFYFCVKLTDSDGYQTRRVYRLLIGPSGSTLRVVTPNPVPPMVVGAAYSITFYATGGSGTGYSWTNIAVPGGFTATPNGSSVTITGTGTAGNKTFTMQVTDSLAATAQGTSTVTPSAATTALTAFLNLTTNILPSAFRGRPYNFTCSSVAGSGLNYQWSQIGGNLPPGLQLVPRGYVLHLQGVPLAVGTFTYVIKVTDSVGNSATASVQIVVADIIKHYGGDVYQRALFVADRSGSMAGARINTLQLELVTNVLAMEATDQFDVVGFGTTVVTMWSGIRYATPANKAEALAYLEGGGLTLIGSTATYTALQYAFRQYPTNLLSMFLVTDGAPTASYGSEADIIRDTPVWLATFPSCQFTAVGVQAIGALETFLMQLAAACNGPYISR